MYTIVKVTKITHLQFLTGATDVWCAQDGWSLFWLVVFLWVLGWLIQDVIYKGILPMA